MKLKMTATIATLFNSAMEKLGVGWRIEEYTPLRSAQAILDTPALLAVHKRSQMMTGDKPLAEGVTAADILANATEVLKSYLGGRPMVMHLARRMEEGWKWYLSIMYRLPNTGVMDGYSRLLASAISGKSFWTLIYVATDEEDFPYFDEAQSSRTPKDVILNGVAGIKSQPAGLEAKYLPKLWVELMGSELNHTEVTSEQWFPLRERYASEIEVADTFVTKHKDMPRKDFIALLYLKHVLLHKSEAVEKLLEAFATGITRTQNEKQMYDLRAIIKQYTNSLHERNLLPAIREAFSAAENGLTFEFEPVKERVKGKLVATSVQCHVKKRRKAAAVGN